MSEEKCPTLKWGDIIRIHGVNLSTTAQTKGLIISKGFTDSNLYYQKYENFSEVNFYRESLFQILPRSNFDMHDQLQDESLPQQHKESIKSRAKSEVDGLQNVLQSKVGSEVKYGSEVIFKHVQSQSYLRGILKAADVGEGAFKVEVSSLLSSQVIFKLTSHRSYERDDDVIFYDDPLQIYHAGSDCFTNFLDSEENIMIYLDLDVKHPDLEEGNDFIQFERQRPIIKKPKNTRVPVINENKSKCLWKFIEHCSYDEYIKKNKIKSHDIVNFMHTKKKGLVSSTLPFPNTYYLKESEDKSYSYESFWELIPKKVSESSTETCKSFKARNIITGKQLTFQDQEVQITPNVEQGATELQTQGLINLIVEVDGKQKKLQRNKIFPIVEGIPKIVEAYEKKVQKIDFKTVDKMTEDTFKIYKVDEGTMLDIQFAISSLEPLVKFVELIIEKYANYQKQFNYKDSFKSFSVADEEFLINIIAILKMLIQKIFGAQSFKEIYSGKTPQKHIQKIYVQIGLTQILVEILNILYKPFKYIVDNESAEDRAIKKKIEEIFQHCYILLQKIAVQLEDNRIYISRWVDLFLDHSKNINRSYIQDCLVGILNNNPISIEATINEDKIKGLIHSFYEYEEARKKNPSAPMTVKYLRLFSTFIKCEKIIIKNNQLIILEQFLRDMRNDDYSFRFRIQNKQNTEGEDKIKDKEVQICFGPHDFMTIPKFYDDWKNIWNYFTFYVNLLADVCMDRNKEGIENVCALLPLQTIAIILSDPEVKKMNEVIAKENDDWILIKNVHEPFLRVAHHVYINNEKFSPIKRIKKISQWYREARVQETYDKYGQKQIIVIPENINTSKRQYNGEKEEEEKDYLMSILSYIKDFLYSENTYINISILYTVLNLLRETIILGLWNSIHQYRELIPLLAMSIVKIQNHFLFKASSEDIQNGRVANEIVESNKNSLLQKNPEIALKIDCKIKASEIIRLMNELEIDIRLRYIMKFFKGVYETTENFGSYDHIEKEKYHPQASEKDIERSQENKKKLYQLDGKDLLGGVKKVSEDQEILMKENVWYNKLNQMTPFTFSKLHAEEQAKNRYLFQGVPKETDTQQDFDIRFKSMVLSLLELSGFKEDKIMNSSLRMLRTMFEQRKDLLDYFKAILICGKGNLNEVYLTLKFMREKFNMLNNFNIKNFQDDSDERFPYAIWKPYDNSEKKKENKSGIIQDLFFLTRTLKDNISLKNIEELMSVDPEVFSSNEVHNYLDEKQKNNELFQAVNLAEGIYIPLIQYIKIMKEEQKPKKNHQDLLRSIFQYLTLLCFNFLEAKQILMEYIPDILPYLSRQVGAAAFISQICKNNKILVTNEEIVTKIIEASLESCLDMEQTIVFANLVSKYSSQTEEVVENKDYEKSLILQSLKGILIFNEQGFKKNQEILMNKLQEGRYRRLIYKNRCEFRSSIGDFDLNPEEAYVCHHFQLLSQIVESKHLVNIGKLENIHPYTYCLECLKNTNRWQIRRAIRSYINRLYYVNKEKDLFLFEQFIRKEFDILNSELSDLFDLHKNKTLTDTKKVKNGIRFIYAESEITVMMLQIFITIHQMFLKPEFNKILIKQIQKQSKYNVGNRVLHDKIIKLFKFIGALTLLYPETKTISKFLAELKRLLENIIKDVMEPKYLSHKSSPITDDHVDKMEPGEELETEKKSYVYDHSKTFFRNLSIKLRQANKEKKVKKALERLQKMQEGGEYSNTESIFLFYKQTISKPYHAQKDKNSPGVEAPHLKTNTSQRFKVLAKPQLTENEENNELNTRLKKVKNLLESSSKIEKFKQDEFYKLVEIFINLDKFSESYYEKYWLEMGENKTKTIYNVHQIITNVFNLIQQKPKSFKDTEKIFFIRLVKCYITEAVEEKQNYKNPIDQWDAQYVKEHQKLFVKRQNDIRKCGGSDFIISILKQDNLSNRVELLNEALLLGIAYLFGGNRNCQNSILESLTKDGDNLMLLSFKSLIKKISEFLIDVRKMHDSERKRQYNYCIVDTYDYYSTDEHTLLKYFNQKVLDKYEVQIEYQFQYALCRLFRFLQLFGENNNKEMKRFLTEQINDNGKKKTNSINFIEEGCLVLRNLYKIMNNRTVSIPKFILGFIGQITQMPCINNQISFIKSTYFEDLSYMASFFSSEENKNLRKIQIVPEDDNNLCALYQIYEESIKIALSNFEGREVIIISEFINKCHPRFLWICIKINFWALLKERYPDLVVSEPFSEEQQIKKTLESLTVKNLDNILKEEKKGGNQFNEDSPILKILNVLMIIKHIEDWVKKKDDYLTSLPENSDDSERSQYNKGRKFLDSFREAAEVDFFLAGNFLELFNKLILQIQVSCDNGIKSDFQFIYFPNYPIFQYLAAETCDSIMMNVKRGTQRDKLISLLSFRKKVFFEIQWNYELNYYQGQVFGYKIERPITSSLCQDVRKWARYFSYLICFLLVFFIYVDHDVQEQSSLFVFDNTFTMIIIRTLCLIQLGLTIIYCYLWGKMRAKLALKKFKGFEDEEQKEEAEIEEKDDKKEGKVKQIENKQIEDEDEKGPQEGWIYVQKHLLHFSKKMFSYFGSLGQTIVNNSIYQDYIEPIIAISQTQSGFLSLALFVVASFLGNFYGVQWYTIHLFDFFVSIPMLSNVFKAIVINIKVLTILSLLATAFILVFNVLSFSTYTSVIYEEDIPEEPCVDILNCVLQLYTSGAIGDDMDEFDFGRFVFDTAYVVFMELLFQGLVGGIMIDSFAGLREEDDERDEDKKGQCYICSMTRANMQKVGTTFNKHIEGHHLWKYLYYIYFLENKDSTDYTGVQYEISDKIRSEEVSWFPAKGEDDGGNQIKPEMQELEEKIKCWQEADLELVDKGMKAMEKVEKIMSKKVEKIEGEKDEN